MKCYFLVALTLFSLPAFAVTPQELIGAVTPSIVYLEITDDKGNFMDSGSGFVVSHDGYVVTVAHLTPEPGHRLWATIGQREGTRYPLQFRERDDASDVALWQLPQAAVCRSAATISSKPVKVLDRVVVLGFPGKDGLTPSSVGLNNLSSPGLGFYKADGHLRPGNSGGPAFNADGHVVAIVQGGTIAGAESNDLIPVALATNLLKKRNVRAGIDEPISFDDSCYARCQHASHGVRGWDVETTWGPVNTGWLGGGHNPTDECNKLIAAELASKPGAQIELLPGKDGRWETHYKDLLGRVEYKYFCKGTLRSGAKYHEKQSAACPLVN